MAAQEPTLESVSSSPKPTSPHQLRVAPSPEFSPSRFDLPPTQSPGSAINLTPFPSPGSINLSPCPSNIMLTPIGPQSLTLSPMLELVPADRDYQNVEPEDTSTKHVTTGNYAKKKVYIPPYLNE